MMANPESDEDIKKQDIEREDSKNVDVAQPKDRRLLTKKSERSKRTTKKNSGKKTSSQESNMEVKYTSTPESQSVQAKSQNPV